MYEIVVIGTSMGGLVAMETLLDGLPGDFPIPLAVVQHRSPDAGELLVRLLQRHTSLKVREPLDKEPINVGMVYVAPPDYHLLVEPGEFALSTDPPVMYARPSIDVLFETAADAYRSGAIGVVLTGASADGARGAAKVKREGGYLIVQDPASAESGVMPRAAIAAAKPDEVVPLEGIALSLHRLSLRQSEGRRDR